MDWRPASEKPPEKQLLLIDTYCYGNYDHHGGILLGGYFDGEWYYIIGLDEKKLKDTGCDVAWWVLVTDPPEKE